MKIVAMTVCCIDIYQNLGLECIGGNSINFATQCIKSGVQNSSVLGAIGNDRFGEKVIEYLNVKSIGISHLHVTKGRTASNKITITENGDRFFPEGSWDGGVYTNFKLSSDDWDYVYTHDILAIPCLDPNFHDAIMNKRHNTKLVVDFMDTRDYNALINALPQIDICFISGDEDVIQRLKPLSTKFDTLFAITLGAHGSTVFYHGIEYHIDATPVSKVVDTTGCGDAYQGAFTVSWFKDSNIPTAMEKASKASSIILSHYGGVS